MIVKELLVEGAQKLKAVNVERAYNEARLLLAHILNVKVEDLVTNDGNIVPEDDQIEFFELVERRLKFEPIAHLLGQKEFYSLSFKVSKDVLIPRPETEELVEEVLNWVKTKNMSEGRVLDLGTGSGCIAITLSKNLGKNFNIVGLDNSEAALKIAGENSEMNKADVEWLRGDLLHPFAAQSIGKFNIIVSNPPYIPSAEMDSLQVDVKDFEPHAALDGGEDGLDYLKKIVNDWTMFLAPGGLLALETSGSAHIKKLSKLLEERPGKVWSAGPHLFFESN